ncbi:hypothetical protein C5B42_03205 [Candidatus Cerribacteria bacterium 'Amazon FNV 2010 28 9']|uniref:Uncharacterized protein n=1 Tax=Candidatus Cerribacteria bacterium 'Amazon FNV 2010 28 9' TaxID=2081795 RepID=A0A317JP30_9BACT|nr:MAG: hypothetical protein C5B42_03205 [Candidatus Cerribacteria bacterium 'Amazon FNV 2010 28 9']
MNKQADEKGTPEGKPQPSLQEQLDALSPKEKSDLGMGVLVVALIAATLIATWVILGLATSGGVFGYLLAFVAVALLVGGFLWQRILA